MLTCLTGWAEPLPATTTAKLPRVAASVTCFIPVRDHHVYSPIVIRTAPASHSKFAVHFHGGVSCGLVDHSLSGVRAYLEPARWCRESPGGPMTAHHNSGNQRVVWRAHCPQN